MIWCSCANATTRLKYSFVMTTEVGLFGEFNHISLAFLATSFGIAWRSGKKPFALVSGMRCETPPQKLVPTGYTG